MVRLDDDRVASVDDWANAQADKPSLPEAIRQLVEKAVTRKKRKRK